MDIGVLFVGVETTPHVGTSSVTWCVRERVAVVEHLFILWKGVVHLLGDDVFLGFRVQLEVVHGFDEHVGLLVHVTVDLHTAVQCVVGLLFGAVVRVGGGVFQLVPVRDVGEFLEDALHGDVRWLKVAIHRNLATV